MRVGVLLLTFVVSACGSPPPPPPKAPPPSMKKVPPLEADLGGKHLAVRFADVPADDRSHAAPKIQLIELDGTTIYPRDCAAKSKTPLLACSKAHRAITNAVDFHMVANRVTDALVELLIAGRSASSLECGAYDYWVLRVDKHGFSASEPATGCFTVPSLDADALNPVVEWSPSLTVRTFDEKSSPFALVLGPGASTWKVTKSKKP